MAAACPSHGSKQRIEVAFDAKRTLNDGQSGPIVRQVGLSHLSHVGRCGFRPSERWMTPFLDGEHFDVETTRVLGVAYEMVCIALRIGDCDDDIKQVIATKIIALAKAGERHPDILCEEILKDIRRPQQWAVSLCRALLAGRYYLNIHTAAHRPGEVRGQVTRAK